MRNVVQGYLNKRINDHSAVLDLCTTKATLLGLKKAKREFFLLSNTLTESF